MLSALVDVFRLRQYFDVATRVRELGGDLADDVGFLDVARRAVLPLPFDRRPEERHPFGELEPEHLERLSLRRVALVATGGSGALASVVGAGRAFEECGIAPAADLRVLGLGALRVPASRAGVPADEAAAFTLALRPRRLRRRRLARASPRLVPTPRARVRGDHPRRPPRGDLPRLLGDMHARRAADPGVRADLEHRAQPASSTSARGRIPDMTGRPRRAHGDLAAAVRRAGRARRRLLVRRRHRRHLPGRDPSSTSKRRCDVAVAVNGFYPPEFAGEDATGWQDRAASILYVAGQVRTCQQAELARAEPAPTAGRMPRSASIEPVPYEKVRGARLLPAVPRHQRLAAFMRVGRDVAREALVGAEHRAPRDPRTRACVAGRCRSRRHSSSRSTALASPNKSFPVAGTLAEQLDADLVLVTATWDEQDDRDAAATYLRQVATETPARVVDTIVADGPAPIAAIIAAARGGPDRMVCMTTHGHGRFRWAMIGSVAEGVVSRSDVPVVLASPRCRAESLQVPGRVVICVDGTDRVFVRRPARMRMGPSLASRHRSRVRRPSSRRRRCRPSRHGARSGGRGG